MEGKGHEVVIKAQQSQLAPNSVVQTGVKSAGCENRIAQLPSM
jgi:hypothetical protein